MTGSQSSAVTEGRNSMDSWIPKDG